MKNRILESAVLAALGCSMVTVIPTAVAAEGDAFVYTGSVTAGVQIVDESGDTSNLQKYSDGLEDGVIVPNFDVLGEKGATYFGFTGTDIGQKDQYIGLSGGQYGLFDVSLSYDEWYRNYTDGVFLGTRARNNYWAVDDTIQQTLAAGFTPLNVAPTAAGQANLLQYLANAEVVGLDQQRKIAGAAVRFRPMQGLNLRAGYTHEDRDGLKAVSSGGYRRSATGATALGGLGENFRTYGLELPMPTEYSTTGIDAGLDFQKGRWYFDVGYTYTKFQNDVGSITYDNPLLFTGQSGQVGGAALHQMDLAPEYDSSALSFTGVVSDLPLHSRINVSLAQDEVKQNDAFLPYTANPALLDDAGQVVANLSLPAKNLDGKVTTTFANVVLSSRPIQPLTVDLRYNLYDYQNDSKRILWDGWASIGEATWKDYDGSIAAQQPYYNRVPEYERTRIGGDVVYSLGDSIKLKGEYTNEKYDRNSDRYADNSDDTFRLSAQWLVSDWGTLRVGYLNEQRNIDGKYAVKLANGVQEEWEELRMFDQAARDSDGFDVYVGIDPIDRVSFGLSLSQRKDSYDDEYYGLHEGESFMAGADVSWHIADGYSLTAYYSFDELKTTQLDRAKSDLTGGGAFAIPQNDWRTEIKDSSDAYGLEFEAALIPEKMTFNVSADFSKGTTEFKTRNTDYLAGTTTSGATAYPWPNVDIESTQIKAGLSYQWSKEMSTDLTYLYLKQDIKDFATDGAKTYWGSGATDTQGNTMSHQVFMDANPYDYDANVFMLTVNYSF